MGAALALALGPTPDCDCPSPEKLSVVPAHQMRDVVAEAQDTALARCEVERRELLEELGYRGIAYYGGRFVRDTLWTERTERVRR